MQSTTGPNRFSVVPQVKTPRSTFDRSHGYKTTFNAGDLVPVYVDEALPGDTFRMRATMFARLLSPLKQPIMDNMFLDVHYFGVPYRLVYEFWEEMNGQQANPDDPTDYLIPQVESPASVGAAVGSLADYMGIPVGIPDLPFSAMWFRAYNKIFNTWYRDENLQDSVPENIDEGPDDYTDYTILKRCKRPDYFTKCLPWPQKGPDVLFPIAGIAPVSAVDPGSTLGVPNSPVEFIRDGAPDTVHSLNLDGAIQFDNAPGGVGTQTAAAQVIANGIPAANFVGFLEADLNLTTGATINMIRESVTLQHLFEMDARGGTRYTENIRMMFGVHSPDERLQRPEYLGGGTFAVNVHPITNMTQIAGESTLGNLAATGTIAVKGAGFSKSFTEHTLILGIVSVRADLTYQQGLHRMWSRRTRIDHYVPPLANLGEQAVLNKELFCQGPAVINPISTEPYDDEAFGYQERWAEYRYKPSMITGQLRSGVANTFDIWHLAQELAGVGDVPPPLNEDFVTEAPPMSRIKAVTTNTPDFILDAFFDLRCARVMPVYSIPGVDRL